MGWIRKRLINLQKRHFGGAFLLLGSGRDIIRTFLKGCVPFSGTLFTENGYPEAEAKRKRSLISQASLGGGDSWTRTNDPIDVNDVLY